MNVTALNKPGSMPIAKPGANARGIPLDAGTVGLGPEVHRLLMDIFGRDTAPDPTEVSRVREICGGITDQLMVAKGLTRERAKAVVNEALGAMIDQVSQGVDDRPREVQTRVRKALDALGIK